MLEDELAKFTQVQGGESGIQRADEVFVEPLCLLYLEAYSLCGIEFFLREIDDEADA